MSDSKQEQEPTPSPSTPPPLMPPPGLFKRIRSTIGRAVTEAVHTRVGRRHIGVWLVVAGTCGAVAAVVHAHPFAGVEPGEVAFRVNRLTGRVEELHEGWALALPELHHIRRYTLREQIYRTDRSSQAQGESPFQSAEGLSLGVAVTVRYSLDGARLRTTAETLPEDVSHALVEPLTDGVLRRIFATHTVKEIFATRRQAIQEEIEADLGPRLAKDGVILRGVFLGNVDLPLEYRQGLESMLTQELSVERMKYTLELKEKAVREAELTADADKVRREREAEAAGSEEIIAAKSKAEAMKHILPFKEREIEQRRLEAEAAKVSRLKLAESEAEARRIESGGEADARRKLAEADAYRVEVTGRADSERLARDGAVLTANPLLIQKTLADKLSDKISVIIAPPEAGGFFASGLVGGLRPTAPPTAVASAAPTPSGDAAQGTTDEEGGE